MRLAPRLRGLEPSATLAMAARAKALRKEGRPIIDLTAGEPDFDTPDAIKDAGHEAIRSGFTKYTPAGGIAELKEAVREKFHEEYGIRCGPGEVTISCGAKHALFNAFMAICGPGDEVVMFSPYWTSYPDIVRMAGGTPIFVPTREATGFVPEPEALEDALTERTVAVILNSPNNPSGAVYPPEILRDLAGILKNRDIFVVSDDIYSILVYGGEVFASIVSWGDEIRSKTILINGVSKTYSMTGWRIGYATGPREVIQAMEAIQSHSTSNPTSISQKAALEALTGTDDSVETMRLEFDKRREGMVKALREIPGFSLTEPKGAFYAFPRVSTLYGKKFDGQEIQGSMGLAEALLEGANVAVIPGMAFGDDDCIRLSYATSMKEITEGVARISAFVREELQ